MDQIPKGIKKYHQKAMDCACKSVSSGQDSPMKARVLSFITHFSRTCPLASKMTMRSAAKAIIGCSKNPLYRRVNIINLQPLVLSLYLSISQLKAGASDSDAADLTQLAEKARLSVVGSLLRSNVFEKWSKDKECALAAVAMFAASSNKAGLLSELIQIKIDTTFDYPLCYKVFQEIASMFSQKSLDTEKLEKILEVIEDYKSLIHFLDTEIKRDAHPALVPLILSLKHLIEVYQNP
ncbi:MAG: hypothetical protein S4CHLAM27_10750 [Chlamydiia bacterium]|nr:hypothetical protein [Chlamydiia bacterium]